ncbi:hypothetical protein BaRGS_00017110 [Batillaria attramentaria]|uniref:Uncharacterized protein n=1 Tax=Batillaria attramentaria TaxID=370345 RepID=A0ABD0KWQ5_9CAEN
MLTRSSLIVSETKTLANIAANGLGSGSLPTTTNQDKYSRSSPTGHRFHSVFVGAAFRDLIGPTQGSRNLCHAEDPRCVCGTSSARPKPLHTGRVAPLAQS